MKVQFFTREKKYKNPRKNAKSKITFGLSFILIALIVFLADFIGIRDFSSSSAITASGKIMSLIIDLLYITLGKWLTISIFSGIGIIFIFSGINEIKNAS